MDTILALLGLALLTVPVLTAMGVMVLWSRSASQRRELADWRAVLWDVQRAGASLEQRVMVLEAARHAPIAHASAPVVTPVPTGWDLRQKVVPVWSSAPPPEPEDEAPTASGEAPAPVSVAEPTLEDVVEERPSEVRAPEAAQVTHERPASPISLEQWLGVRGAAALGAAVLVLAGIYFFKYSIENELLTTTMRVALGAAAGMAATVGAELWVRRRHELLANCLTGAGMAIFYLTFWAAFGLYDLIGAQVAGGLMVLVTISSCAMAIRRSSLAIAALGLAGGFATPSLLSTGSDRPLMLFGYLFLLDGALLFVAYKRRWPGLALLSLVGTSGYQALWLVGRMGPERLGFGMALCTVFAVMFAIAGERRGDDPAGDHLWRWTRAAALAIPMGFAFYLGLADELGASFLHVATLLIGLLAGAGLVARREAWPALSRAGVLLALGALGVWLLTHRLDEDAWLIGAFVVLVGLFLQIMAEASRDDGSFTGTSLWWLGGAMAITVCAVAYAPGIVPWPWMVTWLCLALVMLRNGSLPGREPVVLGGAAALGVGVLLAAAHHLPLTDALGAELFVGFGVALVVVYQLATLLLSYPKARAMSGHAAALLPVMLTLALPGASAMRPGVYAVATLTLLALTAFATARNGASGWLMAATVLTGLAAWWPWQLADADVMGAPWAGPTTDAHVIGLFAHGAAALLICAWPILANERVRHARWTWRTAALGPVMLCLPMATLVRRLHGQTSTAALALALGALTLATLLVARRRARLAAEVDKTATAWLGGATLAFATVAIPLALEHEWVTIGWALLATGLIALWRRVDHAGLRYVALALDAVVFVRLVMVPNVASYHAEVGLPVVNWLAYTYIVPIACLVANVALLRGHERARLRKWEPVTVTGEPITPIVYGAAAILLGFVWLNVTIVDVFSVGSALELTLERVPARDLTLSICWALYGLALLGAGMWRRASGLRKASLALILVTCGKVFLFDLAHLEDLYRVMSLTGLALSLIFVSFAYHRFVFRRPEEKA